MKPQISFHVGSIDRFKRAISEHTHLEIAHRKMTFAGVPVKHNSLMPENCVAIVSGDQVLQIISLDNKMPATISGAG
jgi:hypothetical protein